MTPPWLSIVGKGNAISPESRPAYDATTAWRQLSLFELKPRTIILCLPMLEVHGATFRDLVISHRPKVAIDLRSHPYFTMHTLDRQTTFALFAATPTMYVHRPLDLRPPKDTMASWRIRESALRILAETVASCAGCSGAFAVLINKRPEIAILEQALRDSGPNDSLFDVVFPD